MSLVIVLFVFLVEVKSFNRAFGTNRNNFIYFSLFVFFYEIGVKKS